MIGVLGEGTSKEITSALKINRLANEKFSDRVECFVRVKPNAEAVKKFGLLQTNEELLSGIRPINYFTG